MFNTVNIPSEDKISDAKKIIKKYGPGKEKLSEIQTLEYELNDLSKHIYIKRWQNDSFNKDENFMKMEGGVKWLIYCPILEMQAKLAAARIQFRDDLVIPLFSSPKDSTLRTEIDNLMNKYREIWAFYVFVHPDIYEQIEQESDNGELLIIAKKIDDTIKEKVFNAGNQCITLKEKYINVDKISYVHQIISEAKADIVNELGIKQIPNEGKVESHWLLKLISEYNVTQERSDITPNPNWLWQYSKIELKELIINDLKKDIVR